jgi:5'-phosphate synthase pdxT subunit
MKIGVLSLQGAFIEHKKIIEKLGAECTELRQRDDIEGIDGVILPGGESTVQGKLLKQLGMHDILKEKI